MEKLAGSKKLIPILGLALMVSCSKGNIEQKVDNNSLDKPEVENTDASSPFDAEHFPYQLDEFTAGIHINTSETSVFSNKQLELNIGFKSYTDQIKGYNASLAKSFVQEYAPIGIRFPVGAWANFYNWETDSRDRYNDTIYNNGNFSEQVDKWTGKVHYGIDGLEALYKQKHFDVVWVWNLNYKDQDYAVQRLVDYVDNRGFDVKNIELGNELFWKTQRGTLTNTTSKIVQRSKTFAEVLQNQKNDLRFGMPMSWRRGVGQEGHMQYNKDMCSLGTGFFDAMVLHRYVHTASRNAHDDNPGETDNLTGVSGPQASDFKSVLTARKTFQEDASYLQSYVKKPIWLTEWGVSCGNYAASYLGMTDSYLYFFENNKLWEYVIWFQVFGENNLLMEGGKMGHPIYTKTGYGAVYEILRSVFQNSVMLGTTVDAPELTAGVKAVSARAVKAEDSSNALLILNMSNRSVPVNLSVDGKSFLFTDSKVEDLHFDSLIDNPTWMYKENPLTECELVNGNLILKPYSITKITELLFNK